MRLLALIPARGGSKRLPGKNLLPLGGKPLIKWSIDVLLNISNITGILVSTDDAITAKKAIEMGALAPWLRPASLATDTASSVDVALHALDWYEEEYGSVDGLMLIQPTSPLRSRVTIERGIKLFQDGGGRAVVGVASAVTHPMWALKLKANHIHPWFSRQALSIRSQDLPEAYAITGSFYLISPVDLREQQSFFPENAQPLVQNSLYDSVDIDTHDDYRLAQALLTLMSPNFLSENLRD